MFKDCMLYSRSTCHDRHRSGSSSLFLCNYQVPHRLHLFDGVCLKYCQEAQANGALSIYLPSFTQTWAATGNCKVVPYISGRELNYFQWLITPVHINNNTGVFFL